MDKPGHLLSLKVMRVSQPALANAWEPFYSSSPSFSAHSTASILSLQGNTPLGGHPKTLRDLSHASQLLTLPSSFGSIQLGETFSSCLCVNNEADLEIEAVHLRVEMQTVTSKVLLAEFGGPDSRLAAGDNLENVVHHEIKELGQHVLACTVSYKLPPNSMPISDESGDPSIQTFRKFYKFAVTNPLSVKTKVHAPRSPSALLSLTERDKIFLEVHIQNLTQDPIWFESMHLECVDGWQVEDANMDHDRRNLFSGSNALMQPQDMRQYIYILLPTTARLEPVSPAPGTIIPLGRLELTWRSSYGEPGRLLTSMLSRKIPLPPPIQTPASALPPYLKRGGATTASAPHRPSSPHSRPASPSASHRPGSPFQSRPMSSPIARPQSPLTAPPTAVFSTIPDIEINLVVREIPRDIKTGKPFNISFTLVASAPLLDRHSLLTFVVQHIQPAQSTILPSSAAPPSQDIVGSPRLASPGFSTPSPRTNVFNYALAHQKLLAASQRVTDEQDEHDGFPKPVILPPPCFESDDLSQTKPPAVVFSGSSAIFLPPVELSPAESREVDGTNETTEARGHVSQDFELSFIALRSGFSTVGGVRVLLLTDGEKETTKTLKQWEVVAEVWVSQ